MYQNEGDQQEELQKLDVDYVASFQRDAKKAQPKRRKAYNSTESAKQIVISRPYSDDEEGSLEVFPSTPTAVEAARKLPLKMKKNSCFDNTKRWKWQ